mgnify:CR=1 FL=1
MGKVKISGDGAVREVTLARGEKRNALDADMLAELTEAFAGPPALRERLTVVRAEGSVFCAGLDLRERGGGTFGSSAIETMLHAIELYPLPVVAVVQGDAIAGGNELALHCDFVVASEAARFGMSLARIGLAPSWFLAKKLLEVAGPPPFDVTLGKKSRTAATFDGLREEILELAKEGIQVSRFKGLGEMNADELWETTMNPENRVLVQVSVDDAALADHVFSMLMGDEVEPRRLFIEQNAKYAKLDV